MRDQKFHSGYAHGVITDKGALYFAPASSSRVSEERVLLSSPQPNSYPKAFRKCVQKEMKRSAHLSNSESRLYLRALFSANLPKGILF